MDAVQLPMFIDPDEIIEGTHNGDWDSVDLRGDPDILWQDKRVEAFHNGTLNSVAENGVLIPVVGLLSRWNWNHLKLGNGHHRTICASITGQLLPIIWDDRGNTWADQDWSGQHD